MADDTETQPAPAATTGRAGALTVRAVLAAVVVGERRALAQALWML